MVNLENLPATLKETGYFCDWRYEDRDGKKTKVPYNPRTGKRASSTDRSTFAPLAATVGTVSGFDGLGVGIFDDLGAIDIDHCIDEDGKFSALADDIIVSMAGYTERSPSGRGIRILFRAPGFVYDKDRYFINNQKLGLEVYIAGATNKYVTVTGDAITPGRDLMDRSAALRDVLERYMVRPTDTKDRAPEQQHEVGPSSGTGGTKSSTDWRTKLTAAMERKPELRRLYQLAPDPAHDDSADDMALMNHLAYWLDGDEEAMRAAFLESARGRRAKAHRRDYQDMTIRRAIQDTPRTAADERKAWMDARTQRTPAAASKAEQGAYAPTDGLDRISDDFTDQGNAIRFKDMFHDQFYYVGSWGWVWWDGKRWKNDGGGEGTDPKEAAKLAYLKMCDQMRRDAAQIMMDSPQGDKTAEARYVWAKRSRSKKQTSDALYLAQAIMNRSAEDFDRHEADLNTPAGIVDLRTGALRPHDPKALCTNLTGYAPTDGPCPMWSDFLDFITANDKSLQDHLQLVAGMAAVGAVYYEGMVFFHGTGGNGKSTLVNVLQRIFGSYATTIAPEVLMANRNRTEVTGLAVAKGKRLVVAAETEEGARLSESVMKRMSSTDAISARFLYHDPIVFQPTHTLFLVTNHLPKVGSTDRGTWRRIMTVPFVKRVETERPVIRDYAKRLLEAEGGAIMKWVIDGAVKFYAAGCNIEPPKAVIDATEAYRAAEDWISNFISECCELGDGYKFEEKSQRLYDAYKAWALANGEYVRRTNDFARALEAQGYRKRATMYGKVWEGIRLTESAAMSTQYSGVSYGQ